MPERVELPSLRGHTGKDGGGQDTFIQTFHSTGRGHFDESEEAASLGGDTRAVHEDNLMVFNALQDDKGEAGRAYSPPVAGSEKNGGQLAVAGTVRSHARPGSNTSTDVLHADAEDAVLAAVLERDGYLPAVPYDPEPDGRRYAAMGDAVSVNVIEWIGVRLRAAMDAIA